MKRPQRGLLAITVLLASLSASVGNGEGQGQTPAGKTPNIYSPVGKRDPFRYPLNNAQTRGVAALTALERFNIEQLQLKAILRTDGKSRAMFEDPDGKTYIVFEGDILGRERGTISRILTSEVIVTQRTFNYLGQENLYEKVISLPITEELINQADPIPSAALGAAGTLAGGPLKELGNVIKKLDDRPKELEKFVNEAQGLPNP